ncbi:MAG: dockerin type I domain-containing protein [Pirellulales bacterium]
MRPAALLSALAPLLLNLVISPQPVCGQGHPFDVHPAVSDGRLTTNQSVYADAFDELDGVLFTQNPGFETGTGVLAAGDQLGFALVDKLWYWDGAALVDPPPDTAVSISRGPQSVTVDAASGPRPGFTLATAGASGFIHVHPSYTLESPEPAAGVYGLVLELTSPQYEPSDPFVIALGWFGDSLTVEQYNAGVAAIGTAALLPPLPGDANLDGRVDLTDFGILKQNFGAGTRRSEGDFNRDGQVDLSDFGILKANFGSSANATAVPEPATWTLTLAALIAAFAGRRVWPRSS